MGRKPTIVDIAKALGVSTTTVHRALHGHPKTTAVTRNRVLQMARQLGYKPNLAARSLSSKRSIRISVNTLQGTTSFWDEVRAGIDEERQALNVENVDLEFRTYSLGVGEEAAFEEALSQGVDGIIAFPSQPALLRPLMRRAARQNIPVVFVATDAPASGRLAVVSIDTQVSGSLAADLIGRIVSGRGEVAVTLFDAEITEHAEKFKAFRETARSLYPAMRVLEPIEDHDEYGQSYEKCRKLLQEHPGLVGLYVTTELSIPVIQAAKDMGRSTDLTIVTTDLFPALVNEIQSGVVTATIYQRPRTQGRMAFRQLLEFLMEGQCPPGKLTFAPHLVMRGNLKFFLERETDHSTDEQIPPGEAEASAT